MTEHVVEGLKSNDDIERAIDQHLRVNYRNGRALWGIASYAAGFTGAGGV